MTFANGLVLKDIAYQQIQNQYRVLRHSLERNLVEAAGIEPARLY
jgi:hypothetical protein